LSYGARVTKRDDGNDVFVLLDIQVKIAGLGCPVKFQAGGGFIKIVAPAVKPPLMQNPLPEG
jgi:hypothetical protein